MPIDNTHPYYDDFLAKWQRCRDAYDGEDSVKEAGTTYLPKLEGQTDAEYNAYRSRSVFYGATKRTVSGLTGAVMRIDPQVQAPDEFIKRSADITGTGISLNTFIKEAIVEYIITGRYGILVDHNGDNAYLTGYKSEQITNWSDDFIVLKEQAETIDADDPYKVEYVDQYRELTYSDDFFVTNIWQKSDKDWTIVGAFDPVKRGNLLTVTPFVGITTTGIGMDPLDPPLLDLVNMNMSHYRTSADLEHGRHFTALPTPYVTGIDGDIELRIGAGTAWILPDVQSKAGFLEFTGQGLKALESAMKEKRDAMATLGAQMLEQKKEGVEAAQAVRLKQSSEIAMLINVVKDVEAGINQALSILTDWDDLEPATIKINTDWIDNKLTANDLVALTKSLIDGAISHDTFLWNLSTGEILPPNRTVEEEKNLINDDQTLGNNRIGDSE